ncbi:MAG: hypothetical protein R6U66_11860 [Bacteroidales bacterium]|jgi:small-conductance mechanosensitive channel
MEDFLRLLVQLLVIGAFAFIFLIVWFRLKPFVLHRRRKYTTLALKLSYLTYLLFYLIMLHAYLFTSLFETTHQVTDGHILALLVAGQIPSLAVLLRRRIKHHKWQYYILFSIVNIAATLYFVLFYASSKNLLFI